MFKWKKSVKPVEKKELLQVTSSFLNKLKCLNENIRNARNYRYLHANEHY